jgi:predicted RNA-binding protein YlqC (UPF0109 family)
MICDSPDAANIGKASKLSKNIQTGDLVSISEMVHQDGIPTSRIAVVLSKSTQDSYNVIGKNGKILRFHECLIEVVSKAEVVEII